jgi:hypothetical protein
VIQVTSPAVVPMLFLRLESTHGISSIYIRSRLQGLAH